MSEVKLTFEDVTALVLRLPALDKIRLIERVVPTLGQEWVASVTPKENLSAWQQVYAGLAEDDIAVVERIALDRSHWRVS